MTSDFDEVREAKIETRRQNRQARVMERADRMSQQSQDSEPTESRPFKKRLIPIWLRLLIVVILFVLSVVVGLMVGYGVIGEGNPIDALKVSTWKHLVDLVLDGT